MPLEDGIYKVTITVPASGGLNPTYPTNAQVQQAIIDGFAADNLPVPTSVEVR